ncbi:methyltransferase family protein [Serpentinicella alkaliphila]|uniref:Phospholipid methyltransferase n=1 Tax=Serpentinicella alkaliphila TaxID=1734049 RepID=A0A4R2T9R2_9FIRM|nr:isoprenylcysteine carboxylmethyltransferase family protein [Serpentinicella alkaliphila]QUH26372.1 isoprenylcysteine carboxylmethyltransferase family protein [Serpentinicella alkaliphila]TCP97604.1 phospholipid methyltransferase [Serpentinicella alkaliphila]
MKGAKLISHIFSIVALPFNVLVTIPFILLYVEKSDLSFEYITDKYTLIYLGIILCLIGLVLLITTVRLFINIGKGTLAPWDPTKKLVIEGPYKYVRNPMISGVIFILLGESILFRSKYILIWVTVFFIINNIYFITKEEPGLVKRFGKEYELYRENVPRWIPRLKPWKV